MKKLFLIAMMLVLSVSVIAQQKIQLRSTDKAECLKSDMRSLKASFSFSTIDAQDIQSERGTFSWLSLPNTVIGGNEGDPQIPVVNELIAVPFGANPRIEITSYSTTDYRLSDYGINTLVPRQPSLRKDQRPEEVPFVYNETAYQTRGLRSTPQAMVSVEGTMRGIRIGKMTIEPVSYDPVNNTLRVFNDIEVTVHFDDADARATEEMLVKTYSPYFNGVYKQMFNGRSVRDAYSQHPDLYTTPVKMLVITTSTYANNATFQDWVTWKKQKGIYVDVYTTSQTGTSASAIQSFITTQYNQNHPTFLVIVGDSGDVPQSATGSASLKYTDLYYSSIDGDIFPDMYTSRMPVSSSDELTYLLTKTLQYEQYTMPDPSYLDETLLIAGWDSSWTPKVGKPTIQYANTYYFNSDHGITADVFLTSGSGQTTCYNYINQVGFVNYTAHGSQTGWADPSFSVSSVNSMTNTNKYFWAMGNCCLAADWGYSGTCFAEAMVRAQNKGAWGYIGSCPSTYWWEDYYFGVGATSVSNQMPTMEQTTLGVYDAMFDDDDFNTLNAVPFFGNIAVVYAHANGYSSSSTATDTYYWEAYHTLGDGSVMPYHKNPTANNVSHASTIGIGLSTFTVNADAGSYVSITKDNEILGVAQVGTSGTVNVPITPVTSGGDVLVVVTRQQRQPYMQTIPAVSLDGPYISLDSYTPNTSHVGDNTNLSITFKNVGADATVGSTNITLSANDPSVVTILQGSGSFGVLAPDAVTTVNGFQFSINPGVADGTNVTLHYIAVNGSDTFEGNIVIKANEAVLEYQNLTWNGGFVAGETITLTAKFKNTGHYQAANAVVRMASSSNYLSFSNEPVNVGTIAVDQEVSCQFSVTIAANCPETAQIPVTFTMTADGGLTAEGNETLKNSCIVIFDLHDSYSGNDGWNGASLTVSFDDGTPSESLTIENGSNSATYPLEIGNGTHVTLTWNSGSYDGECSFTVSYEGDLIIYSQTTRPSAGVLYEFDCNCAAASQTYMITVASENTDYGTVSGGGEYGFGQTCTVTATPADGYMFTSWTQDGEVVPGAAASYSFIVGSDMNLVAHFAEGTMIGDGGTATNSYLPSYNYYDYSLSQQIYTIEELGSPGMITSIAFYNGGAEKTRNYDFYMKNTTKSTFSGGSDWETVSEADKVFSGDVTMAADAWTFIVLDAPFIYDGSSNVVLVADDNTGGYTSSPHMACRVFDATGQALYKYQDGTNFDPFAPTSYDGTVLNVKNQLILTKEPFGDCMTPTQLTANEIGPDFVRLSWVEVGASEEWVVVCNGNTFEANTNEDFLLDNLEPETEYTVMVRPACNENLLSSPITITTLEACPVPNSLEVSNNSGYTATVTWGGYNDSYLVQLGVPAFLVTENFDNEIPSSWTNDATYPWTIVDGHVQSGNAGVANSTSSISVTVTYPIDGTISFDFWSRGEGTDSQDYDNSRFYIDNEQMFRYGKHDNWESYSATVTAGTHTFKWEYKKDGSVNQTGDCFIIDNVEMKSGETIWNDPVAVENAEYTFRGLTPETTYCVRVQGVCGETETDLSETVVFTTNEITSVTQTVTLAQGLTWWSTNLDITLEQFKDAIEDALGTTGSATIKSPNGSINYKDGEWRNNMDFDIRQMYKIQVSTDCEITLTGMPVNPSEYEITIGYGSNWVGFLTIGTMSIDEAFSGLNPVEGDVVKSKTGSTTYNGTTWRGSLQTLESGQGYIYQSKATGRSHTELKAVRNSSQLDEKRGCVARHILVFFQKTKKMQNESKKKTKFARLFCNEFQHFIKN